MHKWLQLLRSVDLPSESQVTYIWGGGNTSRLAHQGMLREKLYQKFRIVGYLDRKTAGSQLNGYSVRHPDILKSISKETVFVMISTAYFSVYTEISNTLNELGIKHCLLDAAILKIRTDEVKQAIKLLDGVSQEIFCRLLEKRITLEPIEADLVAGESYFGIPEFCYQRPNEVIIDCGAYVGDTTERFLWRLPLIKKIICIEPEAGNYRALCQRLQRLHREWNCNDEMLVPICAGIDRETKKLSIANGENGIAAIQAQDVLEGSNKVIFWSIDDLLASNRWGEVTYIKADIESFEYNMILGAEKTIRQYRPRMAICIYHSAVDMFSIPLLIHKISPDYRLSVRHHSYGILETVLYIY